MTKTSISNKGIWDDFDKVRSELLALIGPAKLFEKLASGTLIRTPDLTDYQKAWFQDQDLQAALTTANETKAFTQGNQVTTTKQSEYDKEVAKATEWIKAGFTSPKDAPFEGVSHQAIQYAMIETGPHRDALPVTVALKLAFKGDGVPITDEQIAAAIPRAIFTLNKRIKKLVRKKAEEAKAAKTAESQEHSITFKENVRKAIDWIANGFGEKYPGVPEAELKVALRDFITYPHGFGLACFRLTFKVEALVAATVKAGIASNSEAIRYCTVHHEEAVQLLNKHFLEKTDKATAEFTSQYAATVRECRLANGISGEPKVTIHLPQVTIETKIAEDDPDPTATIDRLIDMVKNSKNWGDPIGISQTEYELLKSSELQAKNPLDWEALRTKLNLFDFSGMKPVEATAPFQEPDRPIIGVSRGIHPVKETMKNETPAPLGSEENPFIITYEEFRLLTNPDLKEKHPEEWNELRNKIKSSTWLTIATDPKLEFNKPEEAAKVDDKIFESEEFKAYVLDLFDQAAARVLLASPVGRIVTDDDIQAAIAALTASPEIREAFLKLNKKDNKLCSCCDHTEKKPSELFKFVQANTALRRAAKRRMMKSAIDQMNVLLLCLSDHSVSAEYKTLATAKLRSLGVRESTIHGADWDGDIQSNPPTASDLKTRILRSAKYLQAGINSPRELLEYLENTFEKESTLTESTSYARAVPTALGGFVVRPWLLPPHMFGRSVKGIPGLTATENEAVHLNAGVDSIEDIYNYTVRLIDASIKQPLDKIGADFDGTVDPSAQAMVDAGNNAFSEFKQPSITTVTTDDYSLRPTGATGTLSYDVMSGCLSFKPAAEADNLKADEPITDYVKTAEVVEQLRRKLTAFSSIIEKHQGEVTEENKDAKIARDSEIEKAYIEIRSLMTALEVVNPEQLESLANLTRFRVERQCEEEAKRTKETLEAYRDGSYYIQPIGKLKQELPKTTLTETLAHPEVAVSEIQKCTLTEPDNTRERGETICVSDFFRAGMFVPNPFHPGVFGIVIKKK